MITEKDVWGFAPIHYAVQRGHYEVKYENQDQTKQNVHLTAYKITFDLNSARSIYCILIQELIVLGEH